MKRWITRLVVLGSLAAACLWAWRLLFPNPERLIRRQLSELAQAASFGPKDGPLALLVNPDKIAGLCTVDVFIKVDDFGYTQTLRGRDEVRKAFTAVRTTLTSLTVRFPDIRVQLGPDHESATVYVTANGQVSGERVQLLELRFTMRRTGRDWLIGGVETISTLH